VEEEPNRWAAGAMTRVHLFVEGQTEETFVRELLYDPLVNRGVFLNPILLRTSAQGKDGSAVTVPWCSRPSERHLKLSA
jgi:hypothetical protein